MAASTEQAGADAQAAVAVEVNLGDRAFRWGTAAFAAGGVITLGEMAVEMVRGSAPSLTHFGPGFVTSTEWDPVRDLYGALPYIYGTLVSSLLALLIAVPVSLGVAILLSELAPPWLLRPVSFLVELLAAVPSVIYGLWGVFVL